ncbi:MULTISPECIES: hypothetical protein [Methylobacterium]|uniref:Uncharacterized protein n=1 Tax=Methylobacterium bullatum TaxID=570505 RepID=A0A679K4D8_9HYPH|nr:MULTISPECIES: hypothetical protein [Methylobacterium]KQP02599.1 hypothetical protein ASF26_14280 [Methylobacterium sp. Leaf93]MBD8901241.1 hypothetical protein [Methylobacterium bullatum]TXN25858.1 hypothetical protein FV220_17120 [Methylobacterium sp. WL19]CAA2144276.1 hypothetical protein MBLL_03396 [Methylobacterium bullatum]GJD41242.1 hypothetical protein OICFNHDK_3724 [Methylobacterium bullatum]
MEKALAQAIKGLGKFGPDGLVFSVIILATFGALIAHVDPAWAIGAGCLFCILWLIRNFATARIDLQARKSSLELTAKSRGAPIAAQKPRTKRIPPSSAGSPDQPPPPP